MEFEKQGGTNELFRQLKEIDQRTGMTKDQQARNEMLKESYAHLKNDELQSKQKEESQKVRAGV